ncbi:MAG: AAA family ATPase [Campylobacterota bacterium]|nr:AAA family ATPase [Campylobacterota bacterium]
MYINSLKIDNYQVLEDLEIKFQIPKNGKNIVNIIAGVNGSGKTTLLKWVLGRIFEHYKDYNGTLSIDDKIIFNDTNRGNEVFNYHHKATNDNQYKNGIHSSPRVIYIPSNMTFNYQAQNKLDTQYSFQNIIDANSILGNAEFFIKDYIIKEERLSNKSNPIERTKDAIDKFNEIFKNSDLITKLVNLDVHNQNRPIFNTINGEDVTIDKLSSGEQQLYARVVSLMILNPHNSVILIDEPEIALHPKWQIDIMKIYKSIGKNNQFIVTTHSPFIIAQTPYQNLIFLIKENEKIVAKQFNEAPLDVDINTIVKTVMGAEYIPLNIQELHNNYRVFLDNDQLESEEAEKIKNEILKYESPNSSFFQQINFDKALK